MQQKVSYNEDQPTKLACDACAFAEASRPIKNYREAVGVSPTSTAGNSLATAVMVNIGLP